MFLDVTQIRIQTVQAYTVILEGNWNLTTATNFTEHRAVCMSIP